MTIDVSSFNAWEYPPKVSLLTKARRGVTQICSFNSAAGIPDNRCAANDLLTSVVCLIDSASLCIEI
jgi:hypothetical protein